MKAVKNIMLICFCLLLQGCAISYKFNGASIDYSTTHSISIADFPNNAALVHPPLSNNLSEGIRDLYQRTTRLQLVPKGGDLELEGEITGYTLTPMSISAADSYSAETKLTLTVRVRSAYQTFDSSRLLTDVQDELCRTMITEIAENIYNDTVAKW